MSTSRRPAVSVFSLLLLLLTTACETAEESSPERYYLTGYLTTEAIGTALFALGDDGRLRFFDEGGWRGVGGTLDATVSDAAGYADPLLGWRCFAVDGDGGLHALIDEEWSARGAAEEAPEVEGPCALGVLYDAALQRHQLYALDAGGRLLVDYGGGWRLDEARLETPGPFDLDAFYDPAADDWIILAVDGAGQLHRAQPDSWQAVGEPAAGRAPFRISAFYDSAADDYMVLLLDDAGQLFYYDGAGFTPLGGAVKAAAPLDLFALYNAAADDYSIHCVDADGIAYHFTPDGWDKLQPAGS
ncbi:MAG: hypothetical protein GF399_07240 [Candidatus Coatesbacteria bacterium]|nr:hypothetical protein [Candidatus Coatesbacteria bacterium]